MTHDDFLSRLSAGLDRDEQLARAGAEKSEEWRFADSWGVVGGPFDPKPEHLPPGEEWSAQQARKQTIAFIDGPEAEHIANFDPARTLRQVEAIRKLLRLHSEAEHDSVLSDRDAGFEAGLYAALESLASIYADPAEAGGE